MPKLWIKSRYKGKAPSDNIFQILWSWFSSLDGFTKFAILAIVLIIFVSPAIINNKQIFHPHAASIPTPTPLDTIAPDVVILSPTSGTLADRLERLPLSASAADNTKVNYVEFLVNGLPVCSNLPQPFSCIWTVPGKPHATYTITAKAFDLAGNSAVSSPIIVTSR